MIYRYTGNYNTQADYALHVRNTYTAMRVGRRSFSFSFSKSSGKLPKAIEVRTAYGEEPRRKDRGAA